MRFPYCQGPSATQAAHVAEMCLDATSKRACAREGGLLRSGGQARGCSRRTANRGRRLVAGRSEKPQGCADSALRYRGIDEKEEARAGIALAPPFRARCLLAASGTGCAAIGGGAARSAGCVHRACVRPNASTAGLASGDTECRRVKGVPHLRRSGIVLRTSQALRPGLTCGAPLALRKFWARKIRDAI